MQKGMIKNRISSSLTTTLATAFFVLSAMALLVSSGLQLVSSIRTQQNIISSDLVKVAQNAGKTVSDFVQGKFNTMETVVTIANPVQALPAEQKRFLDGLLGVEPAFRQLILLDPQNQAILVSSRVSPNITPQFAVQLTSNLINSIHLDQRYTSPVYIDNQSSEPLIAMAVPVKNVLGDFQGTLVAEVNLKFMWDLVDQLKVGDSGYAYVVNSVGDILAFSDIARVLKGENVSANYEVDEFIRNPSGTDVTDVNAYQGLKGTTVVGTFVPLGTPDWAVISELPWSEAYREVILQGIWSLIITFGIAVLAGTAGVILARRLAVPVVNLMNTAVQITAGEMDLQASTEGPKEIGALAQAFNSMTAQLRQILTGLEKNVAERTRAIEISADVSRRLSTILDQKQLVFAVVEEIQRAFNYYHAQIYLYDESNENLIMVGGTGEAGKVMLTQGHQIPSGKGLVGRAASTNTIILVTDTTQDENWLPNPLLPETQSEIAVPITLGNRVLGVIDVQHNILSGLSQIDSDLLSSIAAQVAVALQNAQNYAKVQQQVEREAAINEVLERIQRTDSVENALQMAAREVGRLTHATRTRIRVNVAPDGNGQTHN